MSTTTLHIPIDTLVRKQLDAKAKKLGFDSAQAYIRVWAKAEAEGRVLSFGDEWGEPTNEAASRLHVVAAEALNQSSQDELIEYNSVEDFMSGLRGAKKA